MSLFFADLHLEIEADNEDDALKVLEQTGRDALQWPAVVYAWADTVEEDERP